MKKLSILTSLLFVPVLLMGQLSFECTAHPVARVSNPCIRISARVGNLCYG